MTLAHFEELKAYASKHHYKVKPLSFIEGFNYERGKKRHLVIIKRVAS
jgi:hypothetical protein